MITWCNEKQLKNIPILMSWDNVEKYNNGTNLCPFFDLNL